MKNYEINNSTLALISLSENKTKVVEYNESFIVDNPTLKIMEHSCSFFGSSLEGRQKGTNQLIGVTHKCPIIVEESKEIIFFPTMSPRLKECSWINLKHIDRYYYDKNRTIIKFKNNLKIAVNLSYGSIENQILRSTRLESVLRSRKNI